VTRTGSGHGCLATAPAQLACAPGSDGSPTGSGAARLLSIVALWQARIIWELRRDDHGATAVEYGLLLALITAVIIGAVTAMGSAVNTALTNFISAF
jgi:pilus assembly protein Flp/PilA